MSQESTKHEFKKNKALYMREYRARKKQESTSTISSNGIHQQQNLSDTATSYIYPTTSSATLQNIQRQRDFSAAESSTSYGARKEIALAAIESHEKENWPEQSPTRKVQMNLTKKTTSEPSNSHNVRIMSQESTKHKFKKNNVLYMREYRARKKQESKSTGFIQRQRDFSAAESSTSNGAKKRESAMSSNGIHQQQNLSDTATSYIYPTTSSETLQNIQRQRDFSAAESSTSYGAKKPESAMSSNGIHQQQNLSDTATSYIYPTTSSATLQNIQRQRDFSAAESSTSYGAKKPESAMSSNGIHQQQNLSDTATSYIYPTTSSETLQNIQRQRDFSAAESSTSYGAKKPESAMSSNGIHQQQNLSDTATSYIYPTTSSATLQNIQRQRDFSAAESSTSYGAKKPESAMSSNGIHQQQNLSDTATSYIYPTTSSATLQNIQRQRDFSAAESSTSYGARKEIALAAIESHEIENCPEQPNHYTATEPYKRAESSHIYSNTFTASPRKRDLSVAESSTSYRARKKKALAETETREEENYQKQPMHHTAVVTVAFKNADTHAKALAYFQNNFIDNNFGAVCSVCDRLWFEKDLKCVNSQFLPILTTEFPEMDFKTSQICSTCHDSLKNKNSIPSLSKSNGFKFPTRPNHLPELDLISERLVSPRLPFMQIRRLRHGQGQYGILGQIINVPVSVNTMVNSLPRELDDDYCINVHIKRKKLHKSSYLIGLVKKRVLKDWLRYLIDTPLYKFYDITINESFFSLDVLASTSVEDLSEEIDIDESLHAQQQTLFWNEDMYLRIAPGENEVPASVLFDEHCEELSFPSIYLGQFRCFKEGVHVTPYMIATSEIRRADRRAVHPHHLLYMAMKILRIRTRDSLTVAFKFIGKNTKLSREEVQSTGFINGCLERNLAFLRSIPNSTYYWSQRKRDLFAMIRQLGRPTFFLTMSANEIGWARLMKLLYKLKNNGAEINLEDLQNMHYNLKASLVNEDPVTCAIYFNKLINVIISILQSKRLSPFGKHYVQHYFKRVEFQHRGSPHVHILIWLNEAPVDALDNDKIAAQNMIDKLVSITPADASGHAKLQQHKHTFTCYKKKNSTTCRFGAPFMPSRSTVILQPMTTTDPRRSQYSKIYKILWKSLEENEFHNMEEFMNRNKITSYDMYLDILRAGITRPRVFLQRETTEKWINPFNPFILNLLGSNMDLQFVIEEYSCASYVVEYVNKTNRGISNLQRKIIDIMDEHPEFDIVEISRKLSVDMLNCVELTSQEAAWYLLRQDMSRSSVKVVYIPTSWPVEREHVRKCNKLLEKENIAQDSCDIWVENCFNKYQKRPEDLENITLAQAVAYYTISKENQWKRRINPRVIRYRNYDMTADLNEFKREMVTLYLPFRDEENEILAERKYVQLYDDNTVFIMERRLEFESNLDIAKTMQICRDLCIEAGDEDEETTNDINRLSILAQESDPFADFLANAHSDANADLKLATLNRLGPIAKKRDNIMEKNCFNDLMKTANFRQKGLMLHAIWHILKEESQEPLQIFLTGPAGCGKTFSIKLLQEIYNRFSHTDGYCNAYIACASTGKAAVAIDGTTVHTAFKISVGQTKPLPFETAQQYRSLFKYVQSIFIDEISMVSAELNEKIDSRLKQITMINSSYGGKDMFFIGDLRQLPAVRATPIYKQTKNSMVGPTLWRGLRFYELDEVMRQSDIQFSSLLTKVGNGETLDEVQMSLIESRFFTEEEANTLCSNGIRLFFTNHDVHQYNKQILDAAPEKELSIAKDTFIGYHSTQQLAHIRQNLHKMAVLDTGGLPYDLTLVIGRPYMITSNIDVSDGLANGAIGSLEFVEHCENHTQSEDDEILIKRLWLRFPTNSKIGRKIIRKSAQFAQANSIASDLVPISRKNATIYLNNNRTISAKRNHFSLIPACSMTIHKSQGGTFDQIVYSYNKTHDQQLVYVALSRVTSLEGLFIVAPINDRNFHHGRRTANSLLPLRTEFARLADNSLLTRQDELLEFMRKKASISVLIFNCQSLRAHADDLTDVITQECSFLLLSETWLNDNENTLVPNFDCCFQFKRKCERAGGVALYKKKNNTALTVTPNIILKNRQTTNYTLMSKPIGDICGADCVFSNGKKILFVVIYISPNKTVNDIMKFVHFVLLPFSVRSAEYKDVPMMFGGDFNMNFSSDETEAFILFLDQEFNLKLNTSRSTPTTNSSTTIDAVFSRFISIKSEIYVSYFSYHRPIIALIE